MGRLEQLRRKKRIAELRSKTGLMENRNKYLADKMSPDELMVARTKNDTLGEYLRQKAQTNIPGESGDDRFQRLFGGIPDKPVGMGEGISRATLEGMTFGHGGEAKAAAQSLGDDLPSDAKFGSPYDQRVAKERGQLGKFRKSDPWTAYPTEIVAALPTAIATAPANIAKAGLLANAATGGIQGGIYAHGASKGGLLNQAKETGIGAATGGGFGVLGKYLGQGASNLYEGYLKNKAAQSIGMTGPQWQTLTRAMSGDDAMTGAGQARMQAAGPTTMLADSGPGAQSVLDSAIQHSPPAARIANQAVSQRVDDAGKSLTTALNTGMGKPGESTSRALTIYGDKANPLNELYKRAYSQAVDYSSPKGMEIERIVRSQVPANAIKAANDLMRMEGKASQQILADIAENGTVTFRKMPDVRQLDYITRGLNQVASTGEGAGALGGQTQLGAAYQNLSRQIRTNLKDLVPEYKTALNVASDAIRQKNARELGATILDNKTLRSDVAEIVADMGDSEIRKVIEGIRLNIDDKLAQVKRTMTDPNTEGRETYKLITEMSSRANKEKLAMVLPEKDVSAIFKQLEEAAVPFELRASVARNSATSARQAAREGEKEAVEGGAWNALLEGHVLDGGKALIAKITGRSPKKKQQISDDFYIGLVKALTGPRGAEAQQLLEKIQRVQPLINEKTGKVSTAIGSSFKANAPVTSPLVAQPTSDYLLKTGR
tara:strand:+ start:29 stop:2179 length:2151 start_codon:yes stop_codon:yes gene_type:complete